MFRFLLAIMVSLQCMSWSQTLEPARPIRPQEPIPPYPYDEEEVVFQNVADGVFLAGTLTLPRASGPFPAVVLLHGSAPFDRDYSTDGHKFFLVWADHLTKEGIAVLRFDKRSAGKSTGNYDTANLESFAQDALAAVAYLKSHSKIDPQQIGLIGHSEGGATACLAASQSEDIAFVVSLAAPFVSGEEILYAQEPLIQQADGVSEEMISQSKIFRRQVFALLKEESNRTCAIEKLRVLFAKYFNTLDLSQRTIAETYYGSVEQQIQVLNSIWFRYFLQYDPLIALRQVKAPIFALNGEMDFIVTPGQNLDLLVQTLKEVGHNDFTTLRLPRLNHAFQTCQTGSGKEYEQITETVSPMVLQAVSQWILQKTSKESNIQDTHLE